VSERRELPKGGENIMPYRTYSPKQELSEDLTSAEQAGRDFDIKPNTLRKWAKEGKIPSVKILGLLRFRKSELKKLMIERPAKEG
jgi:helix-turn-helix protein